jgi:hypothetical protein
MDLFSHHAFEGTEARATVEIRDIKGDFSWRSSIGGVAQWRWP